MEYLNILIYILFLLVIISTNLYWELFLFGFSCLPLVQNENLGSTSACLIFYFPWCWFYIPLDLGGGLGRTYAFILISPCTISFPAPGGLLYPPMDKNLIWNSKYLITCIEACIVAVGYYETSENPDRYG